MQDDIVNVIATLLTIAGSVGVYKQVAHWLAQRAKREIEHFDRQRDLASQREATDIAAQESAFESLKDSLSLASQVVTAHDRLSARIDALINEVKGLVLNVQKMADQCEKGSSLERSIREDALRKIDAMGNILHATLSDELHKLRVAVMGELTTIRARLDAIDKASRKKDNAHDDPNHRQP